MFQDQETSRDPHFLEVNDTLEELDLSNCGVGIDTAWVLQEAPWVPCGDLTNFNQAHPGTPKVTPRWGWRIIF